MQHKKIWMERLGKNVWWAHKRMEQQQQRQSDRPWQRQKPRVSSLSIPTEEIETPSVSFGSLHPSSSSFLCREKKGTRKFCAFCKTENDVCLLPQRCARKSTHTQEKTGRKVFCLCHPRFETFVKVVPGQNECGETGPLSKGPDREEKISPIHDVSIVAFICFRWSLSSHTSILSLNSRKDLLLKKPTFILSEAK